MSLVDLSNFTSAVINQSSSFGTPTTYELLVNTTIPNRLIYCKEAAGGGQPRYFTISNVNGLLQESQQLYLYSNDAVQLHLSTNNWQILGGFNPSGGFDTNPGGTPVLAPTLFSTQQLPVNSLSLTLSTLNTSQLFVDLRSQSKTLVLPLIQTLSPMTNENSMPFLSMKDVYGNAAANPLYLSTTGNNRLENNTVSNATKIDSNYASIDLLPNKEANVWHILNYYNGSISTGGAYTIDTVEAPLTDVFYISSALTYVDTQEKSKLIMLPESHTVKDSLFYIKDFTGNASLSSIFISTQQNDFIDDTLSSIVLGRPFESARFVSYSTTRYSVTLNYQYGNLPYAFR
jgi:hypothetical protein